MKSPAVVRAAALLREVADDSGVPTSTSVLARRLGVPKSSVVNLCQALVDAHLLRRHESGYTLGWGVAELGHAYMRSLDPVQEFHDYWRERSQPFAYTVQLATLLDGIDMMFIARRAGHSSVQLVGTIGRRMPASCTAAGKALLAGLKPAALEARLDQISELPAMTENSLSSKDELRHELADIRSRGYAINDQETMPGVLCLGASLVGVDASTSESPLPAEQGGLALSMTVVYGPSTERSEPQEWATELEKLLIELGPRLAPGMRPRSGVAHA